MIHVRGMSRHRHFDIWLMLSETPCLWEDLCTILHQGKTVRKLVITKFSSTRSLKGDTALETTTFKQNEDCIPSGSGYRLESTLTSAECIPQTEMVLTSTELDDARSVIGSTRMNFGLNGSKRPHENHERNVRKKGSCC